MDRCCKNVLLDVLPAASRLGISEMDNPSPSDDAIAIMVSDGFVVSLRMYEYIYESNSERARRRNDMRTIRDDQQQSRVFLAAICMNLSPLINDACGSGLH